jgi:hypothetical protein
MKTFLYIIDSVEENDENTNAISKFPPETCHHSDLQIWATIRFVERNISSPFRFKKHD